MTELTTDAAIANDVRGAYADGTETVGAADGRSPTRDVFLAATGECVDGPFTADTGPVDGAVGAGDP